MTQTKFQPILLGSDFNVYGMARAFHEQYQIKSIAYSAGELSPTKYSKIVEIRPFKGFNEDETFLNVLHQFMEEHKHDDIKYLLIACGDGYAQLVSRYKEELSKFFIVPYIDYDLYQQLENKINFYEMCEKYDLPYPSTVVADYSIKNDIPAFVDQIKFTYPMVLKPNDSIEYLKYDFEGKKKAFFIESREEMIDILTKLYHSGYQAEMIIQDMIPGDDSKMRVLNAYVDQNHKVRMMCLGHPLLEDPSPVAVGNYLAILPDFNEEIYQLIQNFLESINYTGFANFDMKFDERDQKYKLFEINLRQGRSSYYVTLNGYNMAKYITEDRIFNLPFTETIYGKGHKLWLGAPKELIQEYVSDPELKAEITNFINKKAYGSTVFYAKDSLMNKLINYYTFSRYKKHFKMYFKKVK